METRLQQYVNNEVRASLVELRQVRSSTARVAASAESSHVARGPRRPTWGPIDRRTRGGASQDMSLMEQRLEQLAFREILRLKAQIITKDDDESTVVAAKGECRGRSRT